MEYRKCDNCGKEQSAFGPAIIITDYNGQELCEECLKIAKDVSNSNKITPPTSEQLQIMMLNKLDLIQKNSEKQTSSLKSINSVLTIFFILFIIGVVIQGCSVLGNIGR